MTEFELQILVLGMGLGVCIDRLLVLIPQYKKQIRRRKQNADNTLGDQLASDRVRSGIMHGLDNAPDVPEKSHRGGEI